MDNAGDDARYSPYNTSRRQKLPIYPQSTINRYEDEDELDEIDEENDVEDDYGNGYPCAVEDDEEEFESRGKKRKLKNLVSGYEFAPRAVASSSAKLSNLGAEWTDHLTFLLLEAWGDRFLQLGRKSLRSEDWHEVAEKVSEESKMERTEGQCRNRLDVLKKKYKKEMEKVEEMGFNSSKWVFFKKMDMLMAMPQRKECGLACGVDSGEYVFMDTRVYLDRSNGFDEMRDSPGESEESNDEGDSDGLPPRRPRRRGDGGEEGSSIRLLANSIKKFGEIYVNIESSKRQHMMDLEKMRMDFHRELELQKKQILERAQVEIANISRRDDEETDTSADNLSE